jgi:hypothetical protein
LTAFYLLEKLRNKFILNGGRKIKNFIRNQIPSYPLAFTNIEVEKLILWDAKIL